MRVFQTAIILAVPALAACHLQEYPTTLDMTTWSVVGVDPETGDVGIAMASCVPETFGDAVGALVPGRGAAATQAGFDLANRNRVFEGLKEGLSAEQIIRRVTDPAVDSALDRRQYGVATINGGAVEVAGYTAERMEGETGEDDGRRWAGIRADASMGVTAQGNTLVGEPVVANALAAFRWDDPVGFNTLPDRLIRALEAGSIAGGDVRCNTDTVRQTAATAMILVARGGDEPYATENIGMTDSGTDKAPWLAISVTVERLGENPLIELRRRYDEWRREQGL